MGLEFQVKDSKVCYTPLKDKCKAIRNLESPKTLKQTRAFKLTPDALFMTYKRSPKSLGGRMKQRKPSKTLKNS